MKASSLVVPLAIGLTTLSVQAANVTWDMNSGSAGAQDGTGIWDDVAANWWNSATTSNVAFATGDNVTIGAGAASTLTLGGNLTAGSVTFTASSGAANVSTVNLGGNTLTTTGTLTLIGNNGAYNTAFTNGTIKLGATGSSAATPDILKTDTGATNYGTVIGATVDVGTGTRYIVGTTGRNDVGRYSGDLRFDGSLTGSATLNFNGGAENSSHNMHFVLNANNATFTGGIVLNRGDLALTNAAALSSSNSVTFNTVSGQRSSLFLFGRSVTIGSLNDTSTGGSRFIRNGSLSTTNGGTNTSGGAVTGSAALGVNADSTLTIQQTVAGTFNGVIADGGNDNAGGASGTYRTLGITKAGSATLTLGGANTYTGATSILGGTLRLTNANALSGTSGVSMAGGTTLDMSGVSGSSTLGKNIALSGTGTTTLNVLSGSGNGTEFSGVISGSTGTLFLNTSTAGDVNGTITLSGANTFTGTANLNRGVLVVKNASALGSSSNLLVMNSNNNFTTGNLRFDSAVTTFANNIRFDWDNGIDGSAAGTNLTGVISGSANGAGWTKVGTGTLTLSGANTFTNGVKVAAGTLNVNHTNALSTGAVTVTGGTLNLGSFNVANAAIALNSGKLTGSAYTGTVNIGGNSAITGTFSGTVNAGTSAARTIDTTGDATFGTLTGQGVFSGGRVNVTSQHLVGNSPGMQTFNNGLGYANGVAISMEIAADGSTSDLVNVFGGLGIGDSVTLSLSLFGAADYGSAFWDANRSFILFDTDGHTGDFASVNLTGLGSALDEGSWSSGWTGNQYALSWTAIPEPGTALLTGLASFILLRRRR